MNRRNRRWNMKILGERILCDVERWEGVVLKLEI